MWGCVLLVAGISNICSVSQYYCSFSGITFIGYFMQFDEQNELSGVTLIGCFMQFDEQKDQVTVERTLRVVFLDPERPSPVRVRHIIFCCCTTLCKCPISNQSNLND